MSNISLLCWHFSINEHFLVSRKPQLCRDMYRRDVWLGQRSLKPIFGARSSDLTWGPVVFAEHSEIWSPSSSIHSIIHRLLSPKLQEWICCVWHQPDVEACSALAEASQCRWSLILDVQWFCTVVYTLVWDINSFCCKFCLQTFKMPVLANNSQGFCRACWGHHYTPQQTLTLFHKQILWPGINSWIILVSLKWKSYFLCSALYDVSPLHFSSEGPMAHWDQLLLFAQPSDGSLGE